MSHITPGAQINHAHTKLFHTKEALNTPRKPAVSIVHNRPNEDNGCISLQMEGDLVVWGSRIQHAKV